MEMGSGRKEWHRAGRRGEERQKEETYLVLSGQTRTKKVVLQDGLILE